MYSAYLARFLLPQSVILYLNFVGTLHKSAGFPNPLLDNWNVASVLKGIRRTYGCTRNARLPMTPQLLLRLRSRLNLSLSQHASFWATCLVAFYGMFRKYHLLPESSTTFDPSKQFTRVDFLHTNYGFLLKVRWSKTIQFGQRCVDIPLVAAPSFELCPVRAILHAFHLTPRAHPHTQAFCFQSCSSSVTPLTYKLFMGMLKIFLTELGIPSKLYGTHSFRRGGASFALEAGVSLDSISLLGDWKSDAMYLYLNLPLSQRLSAQRTMVSYLPLYK